MNWGEVESGVAADQRSENAVAALVQVILQRVLKLSDEIVIRVSGHRR